MSHTLDQIEGKNRKWCILHLQPIWHKRAETQTSSNSRKQLSQNSHSGWLKGDLRYSTWPCVYHVNITDIFTFWSGLTSSTAVYFQAAVLHLFRCIPFPLCLPLLFNEPSLLLALPSLRCLLQLSSGASELVFQWFAAFFLPSTVSRSC